MGQPGPEPSVLVNHDEKAIPFDICDKVIMDPSSTGAQGRRSLVTPEACSRTYPGEPGTSSMTPPGRAGWVDENGRTVGCVESATTHRFAA